MPQSRQLAAIMFTDIVGYTALMGNDEQKAFELLDKNRQIQKPIIEECNGRWIKELGDGVMASFSTVSDAVNAAIKIQKTCNASKEFQLRIGVHLGEVVFENDDVFGDGVNIASRIQTIANPGSIYISETIHRSISNKKEFLTKFVKEEKLKNVKEPVKIYQVIAEGLVQHQMNIGQKIKPKPKVLLISITVVALLIAGYFLKDFYTTQKSNQNVNTNEAIEKSIAVLPFVNMSDDKDQEYFSDGLSEELLNLLAKIPELKVIGRTSSFAFKGKNEDLRIIAQKLGVANLLEGSVRKDGNKIRVTTNLIRASDGSNLWNGTYNSDLKSIFKLQDTIARAVVQNLKLKLLEVPSVSISGTGSIEAYNLILQGNYFYDKLDKDNVARAVDFYNQALAIDSNEAKAWGKLANAISRQAWQNYIDQATGYEKARQAALKTISLDNTNATGYLELADIKLYHDFDWDGAKDAYQMALSLEPGNAEIINGLGSAFRPVGRFKDEEQYCRKSILLDPLKPIVHLNLGNALTYQGRNEEAIASFNKALEINPQFQRAHMYQGRNYLLMNKPDLALKEMEKENLEIFRTFGLVLVYHALGRKKESNESLKEFTDKHQNNWSYLLAQLHAFRGEKDEAYAWLETAYIKKDSWLIWMKGDPLLKNLKSDQRYNAFLKKMNLPLD